MNEMLATMVALWWADKLRGGPTSAKQEAKVISQGPPAAERIIALAKKVRTVSPEKIDLFEEKLYELLINGPDRQTHRYGCSTWPLSFTLDVDYDAQGLLARALELADIKNFQPLPWKTRMGVEGDTATVLAGDEKGLVLCAKTIPTPIEPIRVELGGLGEGRKTIGQQTGLPPDLGVDPDRGSTS